MTVPTPSFGDNGFVVPPESEILIAVKEEINAAFGNQLNMADETPQGQLAVSQTAAIGNANDAFAFLSQQFDPAYNSGRYQDAIARIYFISRIGSRPTAVVCQCGGLPGIVIEQGALATTDDGTTYVATETKIIEATGTVDVTFACTTDGAIPCPANTVTTIFQAINGWDSINNNEEGVIGRATETRSEFEQRRFASVAKNSVGSIPSVLANVLEVDDVLDAYVTENVANSPQTVGGVLLGPKTIYVAAVGGDSEAVARAIWRKKAPGCGYNGNTNVTIYDDNSGYDPPYPAYSVSFQRPDALSVLFKVSIQNNALIPADAEAQVQTAIIAAFAGTDGSQRVRIGSEIFAANFYRSILLLGSWAQIKTIKVGSAQNTSATATGSLGGTAMHITLLLSGSIGAGQTVQGSGVVDGTKIVSQVSGTVGGVGYYTLDRVNPGVTPTTLTMVEATRDTIVPDIDLAPTVSAPNIVLSIT
jgi:hypothetical protein